MNLSSGVCEEEARLSDLNNSGQGHNGTHAVSLQGHYGQVDRFMTIHLFLFLLNKVPPVSSVLPFLPTLNGLNHFGCIRKGLHSKVVAFDRLAAPLKIGKKTNAVQCPVGRPSDVRYATTSMIEYPYCLPPQRNSIIV